MRQVELGKRGEKISVLGQGTWGLKSKKGKEYYEQWKRSLRKGIELGLTHIDTAEFYGRGKAEKIVGEIISEYNRDDLFITTKFFPIHFTPKSMNIAAKKSLKRLGIEYFDLYLIHWPNPLASIKKQMRSLEQLVNQGKTRYIGVSNFSVEQFKHAQQDLKKVELVNNQLHANIIRQIHIHNSLPYYQKEGITMTAYSPLGHKGFSDLSGIIREKLEELAIKNNATIQQIALAWLINQEKVITIPKALKIEHMEDNAKSADIKLTKNDINIFYNLTEK
jgi:diketogulonate reductase-like aldo/keto reductase